MENREREMDWTRILGPAPHVRVRYGIQISINIDNLLSRIMLYAKECDLKRANGVVGGVWREGRYCRSLSKVRIRALKREEGSCDGVLIKALMSLSFILS